MENAPLPADFNPETDSLPYTGPVPMEPRVRHGSEQIGGDDYNSEIEAAVAAMRPRPVKRNHSLSEQVARP